VNEQEASDKWCPMRHVAYNGENGGTVATNVDPYGRNQQEHHCIGSKCMMWRWDGGRPSSVHGYCGLAGKP
jgi:hypothetical protein